MHAQMLNAIIKTCRLRQCEGDCPSPPPFSYDQLEDAVVELHRQLMIEIGPDEHCEAGILHPEAPSGRIPDREYFWLIERRVSPPMWLTEGNDLTADAWRARRFATERAAHDHWRLMSSWRDQCFVTEHLFINRELQQEKV